MIHAIRIGGNVGYRKVDVFSNLPPSINSGRIRLVIQPEGTFILGTKKRAGLYYDTDAGWIHMGSLPSPADLKALVESNDNTNAFTDAEKTKLANL